MSSIEATYRNTSNGWEYHTSPGEVVHALPQVINGLLVVGMISVRAIDTHYVHATIDELRNRVQGVVYTHLYGLI
jgi:hypothetical protein